MAGPPAPPVGTSGATTGSLFLLHPYSIGWRWGEKKAQEQMGGAFLAWALAAFAGDAAVDARSEGPDCVLSAVDHRPDKRVWYEGLDPEATHTDLAAFLGRWTTTLEERGWALQGLTTDGSALDPEPLRIVFGDVPPPLCPCHRRTDLPKGVWKVLATERERLARSPPKGKRGRPSSTEHAARRRARTSQSMQQNSRDGFPERFLWVKRHGKPSARKRLLPMPRGLPQLRQLREIMEHMDALCARRGRTQPALDKRKKWRQWVKRFPGMGDP